MNWQTEPQALGFSIRDTPQSVQSDRGAASLSGGERRAGWTGWSMSGRLGGGGRRKCGLFAPSFPDDGRIGNRAVGPPRDRPRLALRRNRSEASC